MKSFENSLKKNGPKIKTVYRVEITPLHCTLYIAVLVGERTHSMPINPTLHKSMFSMLTIILFNVL